MSRRSRAGASVPLDPVYDERAIYTVAGEVEIAGDIFGPAQLLVFRPGDRITIRANTDARFMALGGEPMDGPRHIWWKSWGAEVFSEPHWQLARYAHEENIIPRGSRLASYFCAGLEFEYRV